ncbi:MAG: ABC transporter ATP-binding protein [Ruminococcus sp.]|uniref:ABC transporter ATP-binding protein n=1 Tax=Ruminococcus sp. TaxID=41978 RepID=UPI0028730D17|nr:ABC transporter ATP-binding protein [Ruminococcus sp.]MBQ3285210.1 ABC transporter ATP-binding protein [Ruminococcus sp.]
MSNEILIIKDVSKKYRLGMIGGTTLRDELQRRRAARKGLEDPTKVVNSKAEAHTGEEFYALRDINITVNEGERVGIIGHNGAGKSTLLKLISQITAPSTGSIEMNGRIASMLEVGTGFHPELSGRENIYMNGAILGMTKAEIDSKMEQIIDFSECRQFIDTPVKRYSSGMYVKLAFSVAAHLDSEIMIMDEVLAVGDMAFQNKCLEKMNQVSAKEGRTILYVSHNMNTIRQLCERCIVLSHGQVVFDGDVEEAINLYLGRKHNFEKEIIVTDEIRELSAPNVPVITRIDMNNSTGIMAFGNNMKFQIDVENRSNKHYDFLLRIIMKSASGNVVTMSSTHNTIGLEGRQKSSYSLEMDTGNVVPGKYTFTFVLYEVGSMNVDNNLDVLRDIAEITIKADADFNHGMPWNSRWWGNVTNGDLEVSEC